MLICPSSTICVFAHMRVLCTCVYLKPGVSVYFCVWDLVYLYLFVSVCVCLCVCVCVSLSVYVPLCVQRKCFFLFFKSPSQPYHSSESWYVSLSLSLFFFSLSLALSHTLTGMSSSFPLPSRSTWVTGWVACGVLVAQIQQGRRGFVTAILFIYPCIYES